jgi:TolA-binding protein
LAGEEQGDAFEQAVRLMRESAERLESAGDSGVQTQRLQEEAIKRLDQLIAQAQRQRSRQQQQQQQQQQSREQREQQAQRQSSQQQQAEAQGQNPGGTGDRDNPGRPGQAARLNPAQLAGSAAWGNLPAHVREALVQGLADRYSSMYQRLTEEYYRRLAEEPKR